MLNKLNKWYCKLKIRVISNKYLEYDLTVSTLADVASKGLYAVVDKIKHRSDLGVKIFEKLLTTGDVAIMHWSLGF